ncbi:MAG TPA: DNA polymerase III subunit delta [Anaeromyxobacteraceae bacterium]|nr:DNA polymerase III subunit delta [Anaeromyxobacteraceae bacterium]
MAGSRKPRRDLSALEEALAEVRDGRPAAVYLLDGDPFLTLRAARQIAEALVPEPQRALNVVELDAAAAPAEVARELATGGLFGGGKAVLVAEPAFLTSREDAGEAFDRALRSWREGKQRDGARRLVALAAKAGWTTADLDPSRADAPDLDDWRRELGVDPEDRIAAEAFLAEAGRYAVERGLQAGKEDAAALEALLSRGLPPGRVLVIAAGKVDGRLPLAKRLAAAGRRITLAVEKEGRWDDERPVLGPVLEALLTGTGKRVDRAAEARLAELVGDDARTLAAEVGKLAAYAGERTVITAEDVEALVARVASDKFFALGNAVESRDLAGALSVLRRSLEDGLSGPQLLASLAGALRRLIVEQERGRLAAPGRRLPSFEAWSAAVLPTIPADELGERKPYGLWMKYQASQRFDRGELLDGLSALAEADLALKSGGDGQVLLERCLVGLLSRREPGRRTA